MFYDFYDKEKNHGYFETQNIKYQNLLISVKKDWDWDIDQSKSTSKKKKKLLEK